MVWGFSPKRHRVVVTGTGSHAAARETRSGTVSTTRVRAHANIRTLYYLYIYISVDPVTSVAESSLTSVRMGSAPTVLGTEGRAIKESFCCFINQTSPRAGYASTERHRRPPPPPARAPALLCRCLLSRNGYRTIICNSDFPPRRNVDNA